MIERKRRIIFVGCAVAAVIGGVFFNAVKTGYFSGKQTPSAQQAQHTNNSPALSALAKLAVKSWASHAGYSREQFGNGWKQAGGCDMRNRVLGRDLQNVVTKSNTDCTVESGLLHDPYTGKTIQFKRGQGTSGAIQIDHVVALSNAWETGGQILDKITREQLANDPLELLAVDGPTNQAKGDSDAATWLPPNKPFQCAYVARQIAVKLKYKLWVTLAEQGAMKNILSYCPAQPLPAN